MLKISMHFRPFFSVIVGDVSEVGCVFCVHMHFFMSWIHKILNIGLYEWNLETTFTFPKVISLSRRNLLFVYCNGIGQHRKHKEHNYTDLVCMALPREVCNVTECKQWVTPIDPDWPHKGITSVNVNCHRLLVG